MNRKLLIGVGALAAAILVVVVAARDWRSAPDETAYAHPIPQTTTADIGGGDALASNGESEVSVADASRSAQTMQGLYSYYADAALFRDCESGYVYPVTFEGDHATLERAYLAARRSAGAEVLATIEGKLVQRPRMEGEGLETVLLVAAFVAIHPDQSCGGYEYDK